jgi:hypothetical protein
VSLLVAVDDFFLTGFITAKNDLFFRGVLPVGLYCTFLLCWYFLTQKKYTCTRAEATMAAFLMVVSTFITLTAVGIWFRGAEMRLVWPFS